MLIFKHENPKLSTWQHILLRTQSFLISSVPSLNKANAVTLSSLQRLCQKFKVIRRKIFLCRLSSKQYSCKDNGAIIFKDFQRKWQGYSVTKLHKKPGSLCSSDLDCVSQCVLVGLSS